jgi:hypothetical protein
MMAQSEATEATEAEGPLTQVLRQDVRNLTREMEYNKMPERPQSLYLTSTETAVQGSDYLSALEELGIDKEDVLCMQRNAQRQVMITFRTPELKQAIIDTGVLQVAGNTVTAQNIDKAWTHVTVYDMPYEMDDDILRIKLEKYGKVLSIRRENIWHGSGKWP